MYLVVISFFFTICYILLNTKNNLLIFQQNFYNENNRYLKWGANNIGKMYCIYDIFLFLIYLANLYWQNYYLLYISFIYLMLFFVKQEKEKEKSIKLPLKVTSRIKRLSFIICLFYILPVLIYIITKDIYYYNFFLSFMILMNFYAVYLAGIVDMPIEKCILTFYKMKALRKLRNNSDLEVIGITGSYGKTSCKNILNSILNEKYSVLATPKNYNTEYGLIISINEYLNNLNEIFIAEMGAYRRWRIKLLCDLVKPKYGILTKIGEAHLETFGSRSNIQKGKFELIEALPKDGVAILNMDDSMQISYKLKNKVKVIWIGIDNEDADVLASNILIKSDGMEFDIYFRESHEKQHFKTSLLGVANVYNILASVALGKYMGMSNKELEIGVRKVKAVEHRLEIKKINDITFIDDAYNSNPVGAKMALDVLKMMNGLKIVVTPGMVELGTEQYELNKKFGENISEVADYVILVGEDQTKPILDGLIEKEYIVNKIFVINNISDAFKIIDKLKVNDETYVLLENDLPDIFTEDKKVGIK